MSKQFSSKAEFNLIDPHREMVTSAILSAAANIPGDKQSAAGEVTACIFSGGYTTDVDLQRLLSVFSKVAIVGMDRDLLEKGLTMQGLRQDHRLKTIGGFDLSGIKDVLNGLSSNGSSPRTDLTKLIETASNTSWSDLPQQVNVSASICVLSQLIAQIVDFVGENHDQFVSLVQTIRRRHLQLLLEQLSSGGWGLLIFEFVSSDSIPMLPQLTGQDLERTLRAAIDAGNYFHGLNPQVILRLFEDDLKDQISVYQFSKPWLWKTPERAYAVTAVLFQKK